MTQDEDETGRFMGGGEQRRGHTGVYRGHNVREFKVHVVEMGKNWKMTVHISININLSLLLIRASVLLVSLPAQPSKWKC